MLVKADKKWDYGIGMIKVDGLEPTPEMKELINKEKKGEISMEEVKKALDRKYKMKRQGCADEGSLFISGYRYKPTPALMLKGAWLEEWGFTSNMPVIVQCEKGKLVITPREEMSFVDAFEGQWLECAIAEEKGRYWLCGG